MLTHFSVEKPEWRYGRQGGRRGPTRMEQWRRGHFRRSTGPESVEGRGGPLARLFWIASILNTSLALIILDVSCFRYGSRSVWGLSVVSFNNRSPENISIETSMILYRIPTVICRLWPFSKKYYPRTPETKIDQSVLFQTFQCLVGL